jgi:hypothetical protein
VRRVGDAWEDVAGPPVEVEQHRQRGTDDRSRSTSQVRGPDQSSGVTVNWSNSADPAQTRMTGWPHCPAAGVVTTVRPSTASYFDLKNP